MPSRARGLAAGANTINRFFDSLALAWGRQSIAVVLSGTGSDGARGVVNVKKASGTVLVQDPQSAMFDDMPNATIATGMVDGVLTLDVLAQEIAAFTSPAGEGCAVAGSSAQRDEAGDDIEGIIELIRKRSRLDLSSYKTKTKPLELRKAPSMDAYEALVRDDPVELETLIQASRFTSPSSSVIRLSGPRCNAT
ncbi:Chemotaxis protein methyltransferase CheR [Candidatus Burkholderia brachyanthoides]|nr:Chemotaxis protein methyltransferase CheR [Candidatus Burkholderia brachyanthoides]